MTRETDGKFATNHWLDRFDYYVKEVHGVDNGPSPKENANVGIDWF